MFMLHDTKRGKQMITLPKVNDRFNPALQRRTELCTSGLKCLKVR